jgi:hypothetical protein
MPRFDRSWRKAMMKRLLLIGLAVTLLAGSVAYPAASAGQEEICKVLAPDEGRRFLPDKVPMETELVAIDFRDYSVIQFPNKTRFAVAALVSQGLGVELQKKYQVVLVSEAKIRLGRWVVPAGIAGAAFDGQPNVDTPARGLVTRDFSGSEIERIVMTLDPESKVSGIKLVPKGAAEFELRIGRYVVQGSLK